MREEFSDQFGGMVDPSQIQQYLQGVDFPVDKQTIVDQAEQRGANDTIMSALDRLPDREYGSPSDVSDALNKIR